MSVVSETNGYEDMSRQAENKAVKTSNTTPIKIIYARRRLQSGWGGQPR